MTATLTEPSTTEPDSDDNPVHLVCCDENIAMCGLDVSGHREWVDEAPTEERCKLCVIVDQHGWPCPVPGCPGG